ncbi:hypothetical protein ARMGADRAFT_1035940 [Armillaria gallica]|uniref:Uncharacterized protein n=1 Tax=Armillaria gallica TaxID=47427 RepID=A0A2H3D587_ARMGA|nr:hypothetical protein ARMGADRAFT_1035940 [Armillaria gallica]
MNVDGDPCHSTDIKSALLLPIISSSLEKIAVDVGATSIGAVPVELQCPCGVKTLIVHLGYPQHSIGHLRVANGITCLQWFSVACEFPWREREKTARENMLKSDRTILTIMAETQTALVPMGLQAHNGRKGMPFELWEDIFLHAIQEKDPIDITQMDRGPWVFGLFTWQTLVFVFIHRGGEIIPVRCYGTLLAMVLTHSKALSLTFSVNFKDEAVGGILIPMLVSNIERWRSVNIVSPRATFSLLASCVVQTSDRLPKLVSMNLRTVEGYDETAWTWDSSDIFSAAPQLRSVGMDGFWMEGIPWMQLTKLSIGSAAVWEVSFGYLSEDTDQGSLGGEESEDSDEGSDWGILTRAESDIHAIHESLKVLNISEVPLLCFLELASLKTLAIWGPILGDTEMWNEFNELTIAFSWICDVRDLALWFTSLKSDVLPALKMVAIQCRDGCIDGDALEEWLLHCKISGAGVEHVHIVCPVFIASPMKQHSLLKMARSELQIKIMNACGDDLLNSADTET